MRGLRVQSDWLALRCVRYNEMLASGQLEAALELTVLAPCKQPPLHLRLLLTALCPFSPNQQALRLPILVPSPPLRPLVVFPPPLQPVQPTLPLPPPTPRTRLRPISHRSATTLPPSCGDEPRRRVTCRLPRLLRTNLRQDLRTLRLPPMRQPRLPAPKLQLRPLRTVQLPLHEPRQGFARSARQRATTT